MPAVVELHLFRHADAAWARLIRPWLEACRGELRRDYLVVPTRGQAHALKQRCLVEGVPLFGIEFLTPGLARKKWLASAAADELALLAQPALGRELLLIALRGLIEKKIAAFPSADPARGFWKSLRSDPGRAFDDFDELLKAGFRSEDFPLPDLRKIFGELEDWTRNLGYALAPLQNEMAALAPPPAGAPAVADRLFVFGLTPEAWGEFFNVAALARRCREIVVVLPEPEFRGQRALDERWIEVWSALLGVAPRVLDAPEPVGPELVAGGLAAGPARVLVGETCADEMALITDEITALLAAGADNIAVVFPRADAAHARLVRLLAERGAAFADLLETGAPPPLEVQAQRALLDFYQGGGRLEELLPLWPLLAALGHVKAPLAAVRAACERIFDECHAHTLNGCAQRLLADRDEGAREAGRLAAHLPPWPDEIVLGQALTLFSALCGKFFLPLPPGWAALEKFSEKEKSFWPRQLA
ncbi:MAG: hypothetical protein KGJ37_01750, partial [Verrucomicrobiota bacterium]|nr:hypothetical protein [Verrucomicrobiota bacterium]